MQKETTIRISSGLLNVLKNFKEENESYEDVIWDFIQPHLELSKDAKRDIKKSVEEYNRGEFFSHEEVKKKYGL